MIDSATDEKLTTLNVQDSCKDLTMEEIAEIQKMTRLPYAVALINTKGDLNIGMTIRTACLLGAERVYLFGRRAWDRRSAVGAQHYVDVKRVLAETVDLSNGLAQLDMTVVRETLFEDGYTPIFIEQHPSAKTLAEMPSFFYGQRAADLLIKPVLVLGPEEGGGFSDALTAEDLIVELPQFGVLRSYNVSQAAAIAMYALVFGYGHRS